MQFFHCSALSSTGSSNFSLPFMQRLGEFSLNHKKFYKCLITMETLAHQCKAVSVSKQLVQKEC